LTIIIYYYQPGQFGPARKPAWWLPRWAWDHTGYLRSSCARDTVRATVPVLEKMPADGGGTTCRVVGFSPSGYGGQPYR